MPAAAVCHESRQNIVEDSSAKDKDHKPQVEPGIKGIAYDKKKDPPQEMGISRYQIIA